MTTRGIFDHLPFSQLFRNSRETTMSSEWDLPWCNGGTLVEKLGRFQPNPSKIQVGDDHQKMTTRGIFDQTTHVRVLAT